MIRKIILVLLALGFLAFGAIFAIGEMNVASKTGDTDHIYAALFGGGLFGLIGLILLIVSFKKRAPSDPEAAAATVWAVGMGSAMGDDGFDDGD